MQVNTLQRYGLRVMIEIAMDDEQTGVLQKNISVRQNISLRYLDHIIRGLKTAGLIRNKSGRKSGYVLARPASEITTLNILNAFQADVQIVDCTDDYYDCELKATCSANPFWTGLNDIIRGYLDGTTLQTLIQRQKDMNSRIKK
ncbi:MAG: Rrf2 family transcriptional regulator [Bacteroidales bacterium]|nr:Rrf2 family transcriptional regulator [Bacteroidales bacterium]